VHLAVWAEFVTTPCATDERGVRGRVVPTTEADVMALITRIQRARRSAAAKQSTVSPRETPEVPITERGSRDLKEREPDSPEVSPDHPLSEVDQSFDDPYWGSHDHTLHQRMDVLREGSDPRQWIRVGRSLTRGIVSRRCTADSTLGLLLQPSP
jgi:hypothetical protein